MKTRTSSPALASALLVAVLIGFCPAWAHADTVALSFTSGVGSGTQQPHNLTLGWSFTLSSPISVTQLGLWDGPGPGTGGTNGDGFGVAHDVTLWTSGGTSLVTATIPNGTTATLLNDFRYVTLGSPVLLAAGDYVISAYYTQASFDVDFANAGTVTTTAPVTFGTAGDTQGSPTPVSVPFHGSRSAVGNVFPSNDIESAPKSFFGPNFQFVGVPETSTWILFLVGGAMMVAVLFRRARCQGNERS